MTPAVPFPLTWLYAPGDRPHVVAKALASGADVVVIDLEDAVAPDRKEYARAATAELLTEPPPVPVHVRVNALDGPLAAADLAAVAPQPGLAGLRLPKVTSAEQIVRVARRTEAAGRPPHAPSRAETPPPGPHQGCAWDTPRGHDPGGAFLGHGSGAPQGYGPETARGHGSGTPPDHSPGPSQDYGPGVSSGRGPGMSPGHGPEAPQGHRCGASPSHGPGASRGHGSPGPQDHGTGLSQGCATCLPHDHGPAIPPGDGPPPWPGTPLPGGGTVLPPGGSALSPPGDGSGLRPGSDPAAALAPGRTPGPEASADAPGPPLYALLENALAIEHAYAIASAHPSLRGVSIGEADLRADLGVRRDAGLDWCRARVVVAARAAGLAPPAQSVHPDIRDLEGLAASCARGRALGFLGRAAIHPRQLPIIERAYLPTDRELEEAETIIKAATTDRGAQALSDGRFIDAAVVAAARRTLALARRY